MSLDSGGSHRVILSSRGIPLIVSRESSLLTATPLLTAECDDKWYELYLVHDVWTILPLVQVVDFDALEDVFGCCRNEAAYRDHAPNPRAITEYCEDKGYVVDPVMFHVAVGMWEETKL